MYVIKNDFLLLCPNEKGADKKRAASVATGDPFSFFFSYARYTSRSPDSRSIAASAAFQLS